MLFANEGHTVPDRLGFRKRIGIVVPSTNTTVQPECEVLRPRGITNHVARSTIKERPLNTESMCRICAMALARPSIRS